MDFHDVAARLLSAAISGVSATRVSELDSDIKSDESREILHLLLSKKLIEIGDSSVYWTTTEGIKFLDLRFNMERMLMAQSSLV